MPEYVTASPGETETLGERLAARLHGGQWVAFTGGMGTGKTTFCRGIARGLGCAAQVSSPTFAIAHLYEGRLPLAHFDAWRITAPEDLEAAGFYDYLEAGAVVALEWSERAAAWLGEPDVRVDMQPLDENVRRITIEGATL